MYYDEGRIVTVDLIDETVLAPLLSRVMEKLPGVHLKYFPLKEDEDQITVYISASVAAEERGFFLDEAEEILQDELELFGRTIRMRPSFDDWGTE